MVEVKHNNVRPDLGDVREYHSAIRSRCFQLYSDPLRLCRDTFSLHLKESLGVNLSIGIDRLNGDDLGRSTLDAIKRGLQSL